MQSQIEKYDTALLNWIDTQFRGVIPEKQLQILFAPPDRPYAEHVSGQVLGHGQLVMPRAALSRSSSSEFDWTRHSLGPIRFAGVQGTARKIMKTTHFPIPIRLVYQLDFWTCFEYEMQALLIQFMRQLYSGIVHLTVEINDIFGAKIIPYFLDGPPVSETQLEPGTDVREIRTTIPLRADAWIWDDVPTLVPRVREVVMRTRDLDSHALLDTARTNSPESIGIGTGAAFTFAATLPRHPVDQGTVVAYSTCGGVEVRGWDIDGAGSIAGAGVSGTINYTSGAISLTFTAAPDSGAFVMVEYAEA